MIFFSVPNRLFVHNANECIIQISKTVSQLSFSSSSSSTKRSRLEPFHIFKARVCLDVTLFVFKAT